jgi:uncharacterized membrane protein YcaP (DUF421 family)
MEIMARATVIYFFLWIMTRGLGKRELAEMTAFEVLLLMVVGDLIQQGVTQEDTSIIGAMLAVGTIGAWILVFSWSGFRFKRARKVLEGVPVVVVRNGRPLLGALHTERVALEEVLEEARNHGIADLRDVEVAILEADGGFSFIPRRG